jgi:cytosine/adenosine deaminase-related metal-dependent hydrolase
MHVAEMDYEQKQFYEQYGMTPVEYLDSIGILNKNFIAAHLVNVNDNDLNILEKRNVGISHNIGANSKGAKGVSPVVKMYKMGLKVGLGTDGAMSGNTLDILTQMPLVGKIHKLHNMDRTLFPASEIVEMATIGGARALNLDEKIGSIEIGKKADLVILETKSVNMFPIYDYYSTIVYAANPSNVDTVIVNGEILVRDKKLIKNSLSEIREEVSTLIDKIAYIANNELSQ